MLFDIIPNIHTAICDIELYATITLRSVCLNVIIDVYIIVITHIIYTTGVYNVDASDNVGNIKRIIAYTANFNITPANNIDPANGLSE
ncbi:hypothetical protein KGF57_004141 (mitochondrion) [Candida theae]|uniref:Uncharacterized protein n=1 Tax=Candida theae TaxID=1198502 RepID=A0AAD5FX86_9ASCO|nr:hypothetical protein KGF57_004141 [Candida theae]